jgi:ankyrin repeat protein
LGNHAKIIKILINAGTDMNAQDEKYDNALQTALLKDHDKVVQILMDAGADVNT